MAMKCLSIRFNNILQSIARRPFMAVGSLLVITILVFSQVLTADYVAYDEPTDILGNPLVLAPLNLDSLRQIFTSFTKNANQYTPLSVTSFWLEYNLWGFNSAVSHFINLTLHLGCVVLVFFLAASLTASSLAGWFIALFWAIHPLQVDTVAWVLERRNLLYALPLFASLLAHARYCDRGRPVFRHLALVLMFFAGLAKTLAFSIPIAWLVIDYLKGRSFNATLGREKLPAFLLAILFIVLLFAGAAGGISRPAAGDLDWNLATYGISFYAGKTLIPTALSPVFEANFANEQALAHGPQLFMALMIFFLLSGWRNKLAAAGFVFFLGHILPLSGLVRVGQRFFAASHFMYVPLFGLLLAIKALAVELAARLRLTAKLPLLACLIATIFATMSYSHCAVWQNTETLYQQALFLDPDNGFARRNLATYYYLQGKNEPAGYHYGELVSRYPQNFSDRHSLVSLLLRLGDYPLAAEHCRELIRLFPDRHEGYAGLASALYLSGDYESSLAQSAKAIAIDKKNGTLYYNRALTRLAVNDLTAAEQDFSTSLSFNSTDAKSLLMRAEVRRQLAFYPEAMADLLSLVNNFPENLVVQVKLFELQCEMCQHESAIMSLFDLLDKVQKADSARRNSLLDIYGNAFVDFLLRLLPFRSFIGSLVK